MQHRKAGLAIIRSGVSFSIPIWSLTLRSWIRSWVGELQSLKRHKLGARTIGVDLDPLAWFIVNKQICEFDEASFVAEWKVIQDDIGDKISSHYKTSVNGKTADVIHFFWVELIPCQSCHREFEGHIHYLLHSRKSEKSVNPRRVGFCQKCHEPHTLQNGEKFINCECGEQNRGRKRKPAPREISLPAL